MTSGNYKIFIDEGEAEYARAQKGTSEHFDAGKKLLKALNARISEITSLLDGPWIHNPNNPTGMEDTAKYLKPKRENASRRKSEVIAELKDAGFNVSELG
jgi:hypothetical protein